MWKFISSNLLPYEKYSFFAAFLIIVLEAGLIFSAKLPPEVPLWYSKPWSLTRLSSPLFLYLIPTSSLLILLGNNLLANVALQLEGLISKTISLASLIIIFFGFISLFQILLIVSP